MAESHAVSALVAKRAELAREIEATEEVVSQLERLRLLLLLRRRPANHPAAKPRANTAPIHATSITISDIVGAPLELRGIPAGPLRTQRTRPGLPLHWLQHEAPPASGVHPLPQGD